MYIKAQLDRKTSEHAGAGGAFQVISLEDDQGNDLTNKIDQGTHYFSIDDLKKDLADSLGIDSDDIHIEEV